MQKQEFKLRTLLKDALFKCASSMEFISKTSGIQNVNPPGSVCPDNGHNLEGPHLHPPAR